jgi:putative acetyltransferase
MTATPRLAARPADEAGILAVVDDAFRDDRRDASEEIAIVRGTWAARDGASHVELVADDDGLVVAHALAAAGRIDGSPAPVAGVAPVCVAPSHQGQGLGTALMRALVSEARARPWSVLVLLGEPSFYGRVGFTPAGALGIHYAPAGRDSPHFLALALTRSGAPDHAAAPTRGTFSYCWEGG